MTLDEACLNYPFSADYIFSGLLGSLSSFFVKPVLWCMASVTHFITGHKQTQ